MNATTEKVPAIYPSLAKVFAGVANIPKTGHMKFSTTEYDFLKADDVQERLNPLLSENGVIVSSAYTTRDLEKGNRWWVYVDLELRYYSTIDGSVFPPSDQMPIMATGESVAGDDKSVNKALTQAIKNAHRATFQFASGEKEPDDLTPADEAKTTAVQTKIAAAKKPAPKATSTASPLRDTIRTEWIESGKFTSTYVNALLNDVQTTGLKDDAALTRVIELLAEAEKAGK